MCLEAPRFGILNPIASHLEVKAMLGLLSAAVDGPVPRRITRPGAFRDGSRPAEGGQSSGVRTQKDV